MKPPSPHPCNECPWRREHPAGWLGPLSANEWIALAASEEPIACHKTIPDGYDDERDHWTALARTEQMTQCAGAAIFRANISKLPRNGSVVRLPRDTDAVFAKSTEFLNHHQRTETRVR